MTPSKHYKEGGAGGQLPLMEADRLEEDERFGGQLPLMEADRLEEDEFFGGQLPLFELIDNLISEGINAGDVKKLLDAGIYTCNGLMMHTKKSLTGIKGLSEARVDKICEAAENLLSQGFMTGSDLLIKRKSVVRITTGSQMLDELLGGGIETLCITEAFGEFWSGTTQFPHTYCVSTQLPLHMHGGNEKVPCIDSKEILLSKDTKPISKKFGMRCSVKRQDIEVTPDPMRYTLQHGGRVLLTDKMGHGKTFQVPCKAQRSDRTILHIAGFAIMFIMMMGSPNMASARTIPPCDTSSLTSNIRQFCESNQPTNLCCESLRLAVMSHGGRRCLCNVGDSPDIVRLGLSAESLFWLYSQCTEDTDRFSCGKPGTEERNHSKGKNERGHPHRNRSKNKDRDEDHRPHHVKDHRSDRKHQGEAQQEVQYDISEQNGPQENSAEREEEAPRKRHRENPKTVAQDRTLYYEDRPKSNSLGIKIFAVLVTALIMVSMVSGAAIALNWRPDRRDIRQLLHWVAAAILPQAANRGLEPLPPAAAAPPAAAPADGFPLPVRQEPPLAFFPGPAEIISLLSYMLLQRIRQRF